MKLNTLHIEKTLIGITGYAVWALFAYTDPSQRPDFLRFNIAMVMGTIGLVLRDMQTTKPLPSDIVDTIKPVTPEPFIGVKEV